MAKTVTGNMHEWARVGAEHRLNQLRTEMSAIYATFPELRRGPQPSRPADRVEKPARRRRRRKMSAEARKRISDAQKARWAKQKSQKK